MPVPVPRFSKPVAHPVIKKTSGTLHANPFQNLTRTLPISPPDPPPSYGTREQWIESLPTWRREKPRRIWEDDSTSHFQQSAGQDFHKGLTTAVDAVVIKGERAQACIPPLCTMLDSSQIVIPAKIDDEMHFDLPQWKWEPCMDYMSEILPPQEFAAPNPSPASVDIHTHSYERGAFSPVFEEESPGFGHEAASSPMEPVTPFGDFVDRAVVGAQSSKQTCGIVLHGGESIMPRRNSANAPAVRGSRHTSFGPVAEPPKRPPQVPVSDAITSSAAAYRKLAEPLADWMAHYVWKVCTTGQDLPSNYVNPASIPIARFLDSPPRNLAPSIQSILLSTLLQPSAIFLALWYIVRLPVYCGSITLGPEHVKELRFRTALFGEPRTTTAVGNSVLHLSPVDESVPFRLVLVGCMLANKWLDDHTFSNKTWHSISNVPIHLLNELELLALDLFLYNLSLPCEKWFEWMERIRSYHVSSIPPSHTQPISRPSSNPHMIVGNAIEDILRISSLASHQPVFIGLEERKKERLEKEQAMDDINLDEDGPLREEYLPRRRANGSDSFQKVSPSKNPLLQHNALPPPAKWSPAGDEPILRNKQRMNGDYVAVQAPGVTAFPVWSAPYSHLGESNCQEQAWNSRGSATAIKPSMGYGYEVANHHPPAYLPYPYPHAVPMVHMRTHSFSHENNPQVHGHIRTYSQSCFDYRCNNVYVTPPELSAGKEPTHWYATNPPSYIPPGYAYHSAIVHQAAWIRT
ncbi:hypothetical protein APHAL10511_002108 [Amanita phalloides]|nr:hypothetical protein APHAL10511_002108 [Amanita phalloides]